MRYADTATMYSELEKGRITAVVKIIRTKDPAQRDHFSIYSKSTSASANTFGGFQHVLEFAKLRYERFMSGDKTEYVTIEEPQVKRVQQYRQIDFILPGQLGFSILFSTLFGIAFTFFNLRETLVLKRFYASPVNKMNILLGIGASRLFCHFFLNFTLQHGALTVIEMVLMSVVMLFLLMGVGPIFSSIVKSDTSIP